MDNIDENGMMPVKLVLDMLEELDKRKGDKEPIAGYYSKRAMLKKLLKQAGFDYSNYKKKKVKGDKTLEELKK